MIDDLFLYPRRSHNLQIFPRRSLGGEKRRSGKKRTRRRNRKIRRGRTYWGGGISRRLDRRHHRCREVGADRIYQLSRRSCREKHGYHRSIGGVLLLLRCRPSILIERQRPTRRIQGRLLVLETTFFLRMRSGVLISALPPQGMVQVVSAIE